MLKKCAMGASLCVLLAGCQSGTEPTIDEDFGNAVRQNIAVQTLNPDAGGPDGSTSLDGQRVDQSVERMRTRSNQVNSRQSLINVNN